MIKTDCFLKRFIAALFCSAVLLCLLAAAMPAFSDTIADAEGDSLAIRKNEDVLKVRLTDPRTPTVTRFGQSNRVVITFENTNAMPSLKNLVFERRGTCVEKFEIQMMSRGAVSGPSGGIRFLETPKDMLLIAYVESDVETDVRVDDNYVILHFYRIGQEPEQLRPVPFNSIEDISLDRDGDRETLDIKTAQPTTPSLYEEVDPHRILLSFSNSDLSEKAQNQIHRIMETERNMRIEAMNVGMLPRPYDNMEDSDVYHFVGFPSPLQYNEYEEAGMGLQSRDGIIAIYPDKDEDYNVSLKGGDIYEIVFTKQIHIKEQACGYYELPPPEPASDIYPLEDESGGHLDVNN